jgi:hypothetical protein
VRNLPLQLMIMPGIHPRLLPMAAGAVFYLRFEFYITAVTVQPHVNGVTKYEALIMDVWTSRSNSGKQIIWSAVCAAVGLVLVVRLRNFSGLWSNATAGFLLGALLLFIGGAGFLLSGRQTVVVDPRSRCITITDTNRFFTKKRFIPFSNVVDIHLGYIGKRSNFVTWYYLVLTLRSGEEYPLFSPGRFFEGGLDRSIVMSWQQRLEEYLGLFRQ